MISFSLGNRPSSPIPLYGQLASVLREKIRNGEWEIGMALPALPAICEEYGVSRVTVRQALQLLADEGLVSSSRGRRSTVIRNDMSGRRRLYEVIEPTLAMTADHRIKILDRRDAIALPPEGQFFGIPHPPYVVVKKIHSEGGMPYCLMEIFVSRETFERFPSGRETQEKLARLVFENARPPLVGGRERLTVAAAGLEEAEALEVPLSSPVARLHRIFCDEEGRAIYFGNFSYRGDRFGSERDLTGYVKHNW